MSDSWLEPRQVVAERGLVPTAVAAMTANAFMELPFEALAPTKSLLKRFFSTEPWTDVDDDALADAVGPGDGWWRAPLDDELAVEFGWTGGRFEIRVEGTATIAAPAATDDPLAALAATFEGTIVPEATPNPRTLAFRTGPIHDGPSREYRSAVDAADDPRVARLFREFPDLATVMVARDFVALTLRRPDKWESLLAPVLDVMNTEFATATATATATGVLARESTALTVDSRGKTGIGTARDRAETSLAAAWRDLGALDPSQPGDLERVIDAAAAPETARRQVAASLLGLARPDVAAREWARLVDDSSRLVRRAAIDAIVDVNRDELRPLVERALNDEDAWTRWKALRGLVELGVTPSRAAIQRLATDPDFRVRLEAAAALRP